MGFTEAVRKCLRDWVVFSGRAPRSEYWWFVLFNVIFSFASNIILVAVSAGVPDPENTGSSFGIAFLVFMVLFMVVSIFLTIAGISASVRRLHDKDKSGWFYWLILIPLIGIIVLLVWFCQRGTVGPNRFGDDPLGGDGAAKVFE